MLKNSLIALLTVTTAATAFFAFQKQQELVAIKVLLDDKNDEISSLTENAEGLQNALETAQNELLGFKKAEEERAALEAKMNAANVSEADIEEYGTPCKNWIAKNFSDNGSKAFAQAMAEIEDAWMKDGKYVFEVSFPTRMGASTNNILLCVFDKDKQSMFKPSAFDMNNWRRHN
jgi:hypothetical protein